MQFEYLRRRKRFLEIENIFYFRAAPAVNGLIVIAHGEEIAVHGGKKAHDLELHFVCILKLVHHDIAETPAEIFAGFFEIERFVFREVFFVCREHAFHFLDIAIVFIERGVFFGR